MVTSLEGGTVTRARGGVGDVHLCVVFSKVPMACENLVEQAVVYSTSTTGLSTLTFRGEVVADDGGVEERSEVMYCIEVRTYIYYRLHNGHSCIA